MKKEHLFQDLIFEIFFSGKVFATGHLVFAYPNKRIKNLKISFLGKFQKDILILNEEYEDNDGIIVRNWKFKKISNNTFCGSEKNLIGKTIVKIKNNNLEMKYKYKTNYKYLNFSVIVKDHMYLIDSNTLLNITKISKLGIPLAKAFLVYRKL